MAKREGRSYLILKVDYERAYDCVRWNYLRVGFSNLWLRWIEACVS